MRVLTITALHRYRHPVRALHARAMLARPRTRSPRVRPAGAVAENAAVFRRLPRYDSAGRIEWIQWADLELAAAWGAESVRRFDELLVTYGGATARAEWFELRPGGGQFFADTVAALQAFVRGCQALNVPPLLWVDVDEGELRDLVKSTLVAQGGAIEVKTLVTGIAWDYWPGILDAQQASFERIGAPSLDHDQSVVWDVLTNTIVSRGSFEHARAYVRAAPSEVRWRLSWRGRRPWQIFGYSGDDEWAGLEYPQHIASAIQRERWLERARAARQRAALMALSPWLQVDRLRENVSMYNERIARQWGLARALTFPGRDPKDVRAFLGLVQKLTAERSLAAFERARDRFIDDFRSGGSTAAGTVGALNQAAGAVAAFFVEFTGFIVRILPREWFATPETFVPLPLPLAISGDESATGAPSIAVSAPTGFVRSGRSFDGAPTPLDELLTVVASEIRGELAPLQTQAALRPMATMSRSNVLGQLLGRSTPPTSMPLDPERRSPSEPRRADDGTLEITDAQRFETATRPPLALQRTAETAVVGVSAAVVVTGVVVTAGAIALAVRLLSKSQRR
jgi:hypothetical protein